MQYSAKQKPKNVLTETAISLRFPTNIVFVGATCPTSTACRSRAIPIAVTVCATRTVAVTNTTGAIVSGTIAQIDARARTIAARAIVAWSAQEGVRCVHLSALASLFQPPAYLGLVHGVENRWFLSRLPHLGRSGVTKNAVPTKAWKVCLCETDTDLH